MYYVYAYSREHRAKEKKSVARNDFAVKLERSHKRINKCAIQSETFSTVLVDFDETLVVIFPNSFMNFVGFLVYIFVIFKIAKSA